MASIGNIKNGEKKRVMIVGGAGLLGRTLAEMFRDETDWEIVIATRNYLVDMQGYEGWDSESRQDWKRIILNDRWKPDVIVNAAAMTNVDQCEVDRNAAWKTNVGLVEIITEMCRKVDARLVHFSSDNVFDGVSGPYTENDRPNPINYYGKTKLGAENVCLHSGVDCAVVRTMWLYGVGGEGKRNFVDWVVQSLERGEEIGVVSDEIGNPTLADDVAYATVKIVERGMKGIINIAGPERMSRLQWAERICRIYKLNPDGKLKNLKSADLDRIARRPLESGLITTKASSLLDFNGLSVDNGMSLLRVAAERMGEL